MGGEQARRIVEAICGEAIGVVNLRSKDVMTILLFCRNEHMIEKTGAVLTTCGISLPEEVELANPQGICAVCHVSPSRQLGIGEIPGKCLGSFPSQLSPEGLRLEA